MRMLRGKVVLAIGCTWLVLSCTTNPSGGTGDTCSSNKNCESGTVCLDGKCVPICTENHQCEADQCCLEGGVCGACEGPRLEPPRITDINGSGSVDQDPSHAERHLRDRLVVRGEHLANTTVTLAGTRDEGSYILERCEADSDTQLVLQLPPTLVEGSYLLTVTNQEGDACNGELSILQGEPGSLDASGSEMLIAINDVLASDPLARVHGGLSGQLVSTLYVRGSSLATDRSVTFNGSEQVVEITDGLHLLVLDLSSHTVYDEPVGNFFRTLGVFPANNSNDAYNILIQALAEVAALADSHNYVVVLTSGGDISAMTQDSALASALAAVGSSARFAGVAADEGYALIGGPGLGEGNGMEKIGDGSRGGQGVVATVVVDQAVLGLTSGGIGVGTVDSTTIVDGSIDGLDVADGTITGADLAGDIRIESSLNVADNFMVTSEGDVGIGTTDPEGYALNVMGDTHIAGDTVIDGALLTPGVAHHTQEVVLDAGGWYSVGEVTFESQGDTCDVEGTVWLSSQDAGTSAASFVSSFSLRLAQEDLMGFEPAGNLFVTSHPGHSGLRAFVVELSPASPGPGLTRVVLYKESSATLATMWSSLRVACQGGGEFSPSTTAQTAESPSGSFNPGDPDDPAPGTWTTVGVSLVASGGEARLEGDLAVTGSITGTGLDIDGTIHASGDLNIDTNLVVGGNNISAGGTNLVVDDDVTVTGDVTINSNTLMAQGTTLTVDDNLRATGDVIVEGGRITGQNGENIRIGEADDVIQFVGSGGADNTDLSLDLDGTRPVIYSATDSQVELGDHLQMSDRNILDANTIEANTLTDPEDGTIAVTGGIAATAHVTTSGGIVRGGNSATEFTEVGHGGTHGYVNTVGDGNLDLRHDGVTRMSLTDAGHLSVTGDVTISGNDLHAGGASLNVQDSLWVAGDATVNGNDLIFGSGARVSSNGSDWLGILQNRADDSSYEWFGLYSGSARQGIMLWDGAWSGCRNQANDFCIKAENANNLALYADADIYLNAGGGDIRMMDQIVMADNDILDADTIQANAITDPEDGLVTIAEDDLFVEGGNIRAQVGNDYAKYCMWGNADTTYCVGMYSGQTFGGLNDYAMTFQMNDDADRGWLWRDTAHTASQGAMSLTTAGVLTTAGDATILGGDLYLTSSERLYWDAGSTRFRVSDGLYVDNELRVGGTTYLGTTYADLDCRFVVVEANGEFDGSAQAYCTGTSGVGANYRAMGVACGSVRDATVDRCSIGDDECDYWFETSDLDTICDDVGGHDAVVTCCRFR